jgi:hypothetical protein
MAPPLADDNAPPLGSRKSPKALPQGGQDAEKHKAGKAGSNRSAKIVSHGKGG